MVFKDPGYVKQVCYETLLTLYEKYDPNLVCPMCIVFRPPRSRHCHCCNRCVRKFDHHCPWIRNCVGESNHEVFVLYVIFVALSLADGAQSIAFKYVIPFLQSDFSL